MTETADAPAPWIPYADVTAAVPLPRVFVDHLRKEDFARRKWDTHPVSYHACRALEAAKDEEGSARVRVTAPHAVWEFLLAQAATMELESDDDGGGSDLFFASRGARRQITAVLGVVAQDNLDAARRGVQAFLDAAPTEVPPTGGASLLTPEVGAAVRRDALAAVLSGEATHDDQSHVRAFIEGKPDRGDDALLQIGQHQQRPVLLASHLRTLLAECRTPAQG